MHKCCSRLKGHANFKGSIVNLLSCPTILEPTWGPWLAEYLASGPRFGPIHGKGWIAGPRPLIPSNTNNTCTFLSWIHCSRCHLKQVMSLSLRIYQDSTSMSRMIQRKGGKVGTRDLTFVCLFNLPLGKSIVNLPLGKSHDCHSLTPINSGGI